MYTDRAGKVKKTIYFDENDWVKIEKNAKKLNLSTTKYIRKMVNEGKIINVDFKGAHELTYEIYKIGTNINQLAKKANETHNIYESDLIKLKKGYDEICLMLNQYLSKIQ